MRKILFLLLLTLAACAPQTRMQQAKTLPQDPVALRILLAEMPKGAELHTHLSGIPYGENYIEWAAEDGTSIQPETGKIVPADTPQSIPAQNAYTNPPLWNATVNALSVRQNRQDDRVWGHDQFFATFGLFGLASGHKGRMLAHAAQQANRDRVQYVEAMVSIYDMDRVTTCAQKAGWNDDPASTFDALRLAGLFSTINSMTDLLNDWETNKRSIIGDGPGSEVAMRYINQVYRGGDPATVFAQLAWSFELVKREPRVVGLNMVGPEDAPVSVRDYAMHMAMIAYLHTRYPDVPVTLHAGELTGWVTTPKALSDHIRLAVTEAGARRIGHGVDIAYETDARDTLRLMHEKRVALEVPLTSNDAILHVTGKEHPLRTYMTAGVPVVFSTDDMGVGRTTLTNEFVRAVREHGLTYEDLKTAARNSLEYSFLPGQSLWNDPDEFRMAPVCAGDEAPDAECAAFLGGSEKAALQWDLERQLDEFEAAHKQ